MIRFILNKELHSCDFTASFILLDYLREQHDLTASKESCHQGECGSCLVLFGQIQDDKLVYQAVPSCILALGELHGKHIVTLEGLNQSELNPIQHALIDAGAVQCGFCTPGFIIAITEFFLNSHEHNLNEAKLSLSGNLCRCTGYQAIKNALASLISTVIKTDFSGLIEQRIIPGYFSEIPRRLTELSTTTETSKNSISISGGTDFFIQHPDFLTSLEFLDKNKELKGIRLNKGFCYIGAETTVEELRTSPIMQSILPCIEDDLKLFASKPIRERATLAGNLVNASPIADLSIIFLALNAELELQLGNKYRSIKLIDFFLSYKDTTLQAEELIIGIKISLPILGFHYEKVAKRQHLDIASVNSAIQIKTSQGSIQQIHLSAGGVAPTPLYLEKTIQYLLGKTINADIIKQALKISQSEIQPIEDVRGSSTYKRLLFQQLLIAHFLYLFPKQLSWQDLQPNGVIQ